jgi:hypothetical protein
LVGVVVGLVLLPLVLPAQDFNNSDWPPFAVGGRIIVSGHPGLLYDAGEQRRQWNSVTGVNLPADNAQVNAFTSYLNPPWFALLVAPFAALDNNIGVRLWVLFQLLALGAGLGLLTGAAGRSRMLPAVAGAPAAVMVLTARPTALLSSAWERDGRCGSGATAS